MVGRPCAESRRRVSSFDAKRSSTSGEDLCAATYLFHSSVAFVASARAILEAACILKKRGLNVHPEIMIPLIGSVEEFNHQKKIVVRVAEEVRCVSGTFLRNRSVGVIFSN